VARVWFVAKMIEQKSWNCRAKGKHGGSIGAVGLEVLRTLLFVIKKVDGRLYPSLEAMAKLSRKSKQAVVTAVKVLERMGSLPSTDGSSAFRRHMACASSRIAMPMSFTCR
jgi:hypothetical protein